MRIKNKKIERHEIFPAIISSICLVVIWVSFIGHTPNGWYRNPPYHRFGGFDFGYWYESWALYGGQFVIALLLRKSKYGYRPILSIVIVLLIICILVNLYVFLISLGEPTL